VAAAEASVEFCKNVPMKPAAFLADILVPLKSLATDSHQHVRCALASKALQLTPQCATLDDSQAHMLDLILTLLKDKACPCAPLQRCLRLRLHVFLMQVWVHWAGSVCSIEPVLLYLMLAVLTVALKALAECLEVMLVG
jgi:hypothetical protein